MKGLRFLFPLTTLAAVSLLPASALNDPDIMPLLIEGPKPESPAAAAAATPSSPDVETQPIQNRAEIERDSLLRIGQVKLAAEDFVSALVAYRQVARLEPPPEIAATALLGMARAYTGQGELIKAVASYEHLLKTLDPGVHTPMANLEVGRILRDLGSSKQALARFYSVIHTTLKLSEGDQSSYRQVVRMAQFEIAETHLRAGDYETAVRYFERFELLDADPTDRAWAQFKAAQATELAGRSSAAITAYQRFIRQHPNDERAPEAYFLLASLLEKNDQHRESLRVTLELLQHERSNRQQDQERWRRWQKRTGNQLAGAFFTRGEFHSALALYRALALLSDDPAWRLPLVYQQGLCHERLMDYSLALAAYALIIDTDLDSPAFSSIGRMAQWRADQINWWQGTHQSLRELRPPSSSS